MPARRDDARSVQHQDKAVPQRTRYAVGENRMDITLDDGAARVGLGSPTSPASSLQAVYERFDGEPFGDGSPEYVFVRRVERRRLSRCA
jgi:hypothetical protein